MVLDTEEADAELSIREKLATELQVLRRMSGLSGREMARRIGISQSKVSRIESGHTLPTLEEVNGWADAVAASSGQRRWLVTCTEAAFTEVTTWRTSLRGRPHLQDVVQSSESAARRLEVFQPSVVPGLLQTPQYAHQIFAIQRDMPYGKEQLAQAIAGRLSRQLALYDENRQFDFLITEAALRWRPGPSEVLLAQLDRIAALSTLDNVSIGLIPQDAHGTPYASHAFTILYPSDGEPHVSVETIHARLTVDVVEDVRLYQSRWEQLREAARYDEDARAFLGALRSGLDASGGNDGFRR
ncbi:helix-turn-helix domain-containing protein [Actinomadura scrupuli]|uniref:helix-turn-helix domain-containing protein n=1 Tax=Actinomadura scrupuli TaxID=559629 RepID=UPI003D9696D8